MSNRGEFVVTGSHDKSIRIWEKTEEPLFLEEEREREVEALYDANIPDAMNRHDAAEDGDEVEAVQKQTADTLMAGERILEALELADADRESMREWETDRTTSKPTRNPALLVHGDLSPDEHVLRTIQKIPAASMEDALLVLPFKQVVSLLGYLDEWALKVSTSCRRSQAAVSLIQGIERRIATPYSLPAYSPSSSELTPPN